MSRLIDKVLAGFARPPPYSDARWSEYPQAPLLDSSTAIFADNVVEYMFSGTEQEAWDAGDFPSLAPPFETFWIESSQPKAINSEGTLRIVPSGVGRSFGAFFVAVDDEDRSSGRWRWQLGAAAFVESDDGSVIGPLGVALIRVRHDGSWLEPDGAAMIVAGGDKARQMPEERQSRIRDWIWWKVKPLLLALSFMNCRNVTRARVDPPLALSKKWQKRRGRPLVRGYVLDIQPMRSVLASEGRQSEVGLQRALHICRGHFKDYRERGLFGKHRGMFWWDASVRGSTAHGIVSKDYAVSAPRDPALSHPASETSVGDDRSAPRHTKSAVGEPPGAGKEGGTR